MNSVKKKVLDLEFGLWKDFPVIAGVDEAGRGALAGPIIVAAVILPTNFQSPLIKDSKMLSPDKRKKAYWVVKKVSLEYKIVSNNVREIETKNPSEATKGAMVKAIMKLKSKPDLCLVDGKEKIIIREVETRSIVGGDRRSINIAAASIIAKVTRDTIMKNLCKKYPFYGWEKNKGYPDKSHLRAIFYHGICVLHRKTYEPVKSLLELNCDKEKLWKRYNL